MAFFAALHNSNLVPTGQDDAGARITADPTRTPVAISLVDAEVARLKRFEDAIRNTSDNERNELAKTFGEGYPINLNHVQLPTNNPIQFASTERVIASGVFQNIIENAQLFESYKNVFVIMERFDNNALAPVLEQLPKTFNELADVSSDTPLTETQIRLAINKYQAALSQARASIAEPVISGLEKFKMKVMNSVGALAEELQKSTNDQNSQLTGLETNIPLTARSLYGKTVNQESFTDLLWVFIGVFLLIMIAPYFYPNGVAENVLKAEFLLQFSTVFVLVAAIIILSIGGFIERNQLPVLLAGISGYVLGQLGSNSGRAAVPASPLPPGGAAAPPKTPTT
jgi:hypothetical protein